MAVHDSSISMWIDSVCINQENVAERNKQVSIMANIYRSAASVYVWLGRGDEDTSYAIEHIRDCKPETKFVAATFSECVEKLFKASYWTRRWVIQEFALAERVVIACGTQRTTWDQVARKIDTRVLPEQSIASQTLRKFEEVGRGGQRNDLTLLQLMEKFQHSRCVDQRDKAFALRGIARDGQQLAVKYDESFGDLYFRILSILPTEWIFPIMTGYRWPHQAAKTLLMSMGLTEHDLLDSLLDNSDDCLFTVFEYVGTVVKVENCSQEPLVTDDCEAFTVYPQRVHIQGSTTRHLYGRKFFKTGDVIYTLQSNSQSPKGLYIALAADYTHQSVIGLLLDKPHSKAIAYWQNMQLTQQRMRSIEDILIDGVTRCDKNVLAEESFRVLCHINRKVFILLWLLDIRQIQHLFDCELSLSNPEVEKESSCTCQHGPIDTSRLGKQSEASPSYNLEIMPNFPTSKNDEQWKAASIQPWKFSVSPSLLDDHESHENVWQISDDVRSREMPQLCHAAREGHFAITTYLISRLAVSTGTIDVTGQRTLLLSYRDNYSGVEESLFYTDQIDLNGADNEGRTALSWGAASGHETVVKLLLEGKDIAADLKDKHGRTPLYWAAHNGHEAVVKLLLERKDVVADQKDSYGWTPLWWAAQNGHEAVVKLLLERKDVVTNLKDIDGRTPLWWAATKGNEAVVKLLLKRRDVVANQMDKHNWTPLSLAAQNGDEAVVKLLLERKDVVADLKDKHGWTPLWWAAQNGHEAVVKLLLRRKDVATNLKDKDGRTPLLWAAAKDNEAVVKLLLERRDVAANLKDKDGRTPLSLAAQNGYKAVVKLLIERKDVAADLKDKHGWTPLWWAAHNGHEAVVKLLLERKDVAAGLKDRDDRTPLWLAAHNGDEAVVKLLLERKDVAADLKDKHGQTPLSLAAHNGHEAVVKLLLERKDVAADLKNEDGWTPLRWAAQNGHEAVVKLLLERKDVATNLKDKDGRTPLWGAAHNGHEAVVKLLLERKDVAADLKDKHGRTPLRWAAQNGHEAVVKLLLERKDVATNLKDKDGRTPLRWAAHNGHEAIVKLLLERKDIAANLKDRYGRTPLWWAAQNGHEAVVKLLRLKHS